MVKFEDKLMSALFSKVESNWFKDLFYYITDSGFRLMKRLDKTLYGQLNPVLNIVMDEADKITTYKDQDKQVIAVLKYVLDNYTYLSDQINYGIMEKWADAEEIILKGKDDCDGLNSLVYILCRCKGIIPETLWSCIGQVRTGEGHYWLMYYSTKQDKLYSIDATWYPDRTAIKDRSVFNHNDYRTIWYVFNENTAFKPEG